MFMARGSIQPVIRDVAALQTFSLQKLQVFTVSKFPLHFHCSFCSQSMHAVDYCSQFEMQLKYAFIAVK